MGINVNKILIEKAINNCRSVEYPVLVTGQGFGSDLANALNVIKELNDEVVRLQIVIEELSKLKEREK